MWLQGDNFNNSTDSRHYGPVPYAMLRGRVFVKASVRFLRLTEMHASVNWYTAASRRQSQPACWDAQDLGQ